MDKVNIKDIDRKTGIETHDLIREGRSAELDPIKVAAVLKALADAINFTLVDLEKIHKELGSALKTSRRAVRKANKLKPVQKGGE